MKRKDFGFATGADFVQACRDLVKLHGENAPLVGDPRRRQFTDGGLTITIRTDGSMEVKYLYHRRNGKFLTNPVIMVDAKGEIYRAHGEWTLGRERVRQWLDDPHVMRQRGPQTIASHYADED